MDYYFFLSAGFIWSRSITSKFCLFVCGYIGSCVFYFHTIRGKIIENLKNLAEKGFPLFLVSMYVCLSVITLQTSSFNNIGGWDFNIDTHMWISQNGIGPLLDDRFKENLKNPETLKGCPLYSLSCLSVCLSVTELQSTHFGLGT